MQSKAMFDLDSHNNPVIDLSIVSSGDVRDKIAKRFIEQLGHLSTFCEIYGNESSGYSVFPINPRDLRDRASRMLQQADEYDRMANKRIFDPSGSFVDPSRS